MTNLDTDGIMRYSRNIMLDEIGSQGQMKLLGSSVLVVGGGALGSIVAMYLAASGVGRIGIADFDTVDISNLQRQLSFTERDISSKKAIALSNKLKAINSEIAVETHDCVMTRKNAGDILEGYDVAVEGSDNPDTKYLITDLCTLQGKPCVLGGISGWSGQVMTCHPGNASYRDFFPDAAPPAGCTPCSQGGVLGPLPGIIGSIQATEVIKIITGAGKPLIDRMLMIDALNMRFTEIKV